MVHSCGPLGLILKGRLSRILTVLEAEPKGERESNSCMSDDGRRGREGGEGGEAASGRGAHNKLGSMGEIKREPSPVGHAARGRKAVVGRTIGILGVTQSGIHITKRG